ncbi:hypothetical protein F2981_29610 (plasmid) [Sinorhizobium meliloti]|nr:hypothetical protein [Sinorhizobium meliloti]
MRPERLLRRRRHHLDRSPFRSAVSASPDLLLAATMLPFAFLGFLLSGWGRRLVDRGHVKAIVLIVSAASALVLLLRAFS